jgi:hypothetical protein
MLISTDKAIIPYLAIALFINAAKVAQKSDLTKFFLYLNTAPQTDEQLRGDNKSLSL